MLSEKFRGEWNMFRGTQCHPSRPPVPRPPRVRPALSPRPPRWLLLPQRHAGRPCFPGTDFKPQPPPPPPPPSRRRAGALLVLFGSAGSLAALSHPSPSWDLLFLPEATPRHIHHWTPASRKLGPGTMCGARLERGMEGRAAARSRGTGSPAFAAPTAA